MTTLSATHPAQPSLKVIRQTIEDLPLVQLLSQQFNVKHPHVMLSSQRQLISMLYQFLNEVEEYGFLAAEAGRHELAHYFDTEAYSEVEEMIDEARKRMYTPARLRNEIRMDLKHVYKQTGLIDCDPDTYAIYYPQQ